MFEMLVQRSSPIATPLTPVSTPPEAHTAELSPRSSDSSFGSSDVLLRPPSVPSPNNNDTTQELSALERLQFALARDDLFSSMLNGSSVHRDERLVKLRQGSSSSSIPTSMEDDGNEMDMPSSPSSSGEGMKTQAPATSPTESNVANIFQCPLCAIQCHSRHDFNEHLVTHSQQFGCPKCSFFTDDECKLKEHVMEAHDANDLDVLTDEEVRTPKTNSQGKVKTFKCKHCGYHAVTKLDFWEHSKTHMRQEKVLTCPKCPFVTEYKHHLEYHLRNHFKSKPFQCTKCSYSCVNKSMLNSHLKSHSSVYQYRCSDCAYATKYCHSLKLHLRKYEHKPSMVLNPDGTPNPLPIIDVYGTRRGPKIKRSDPDSIDMGSTMLSPITPKEKNKTQKTPKRQSKASNSSEKQATPPMSPKNATTELVFKPTSIQPMDHLKQENIQAISFPNHETNVLPTKHVLSTLPLNPSIVGPTAIQQWLMQASATAPVNPAAAALQTILIQNSMKAPTIGIIGQSPMEIYASALNQIITANNRAMSSPMDFAKLLEEQRTRLMSQVLHHSQPSPTSSEPRSTGSPPSTLNSQVILGHALDLRNPKRPGQSTATSTANSSDDAKKRKRKGQAFRFERSKDDYTTNVDQVLDFSNNNYTTTNNNVNGDSCKEKESDSETFMCKYCDIAFPPVLYALHMRFHSNDADPFRCNACGTKSSDKVSFFVHLANASH